MTQTPKRTDGGGASESAPAKTLVREHFDAINQRDRSKVADLHADDVVVHSAGREVVGIEAVISDWWAQLEAVPDLQDSIDMLIAEGDRVAVRYTTTGTHEGEFLGIDPTGASVEVTSMALVRIDGDEIVEWWNQPDRFEFFRHLGLIEDPTE